MVETGGRLDNVRVLAAQREVQLPWASKETLLDLIRMRTLTAALKGEAPGAEASIRKILAEELKPEFVGLIEGGKFVPTYAEIVSSTPQGLLDKAAR